MDPVEQEYFLQGLRVERVLQQVDMAAADYALAARALDCLAERAEALRSTAFVWGADPPSLSASASAASLSGLALHGSAASFSSLDAAVMDTAVASASAAAARKARPVFDDW
jgi:hypothetical protein